MLFTYDVESYGNGLNSILFKFTNGYQSSLYGSLSGSASLYSAATGQYITKIIVCVGGPTVSAYIYSIQFFTKGKQSPIFGCPYNVQTDTICYSVSAPGGLLGVQGYADSIVYGLNFVSNQAITTNATAPTTTTSTKTTTATTTKTFTGALRFTLTGHTSDLNTLVQLSNGNLASGASDNTIKIWNHSTGALVYNLTGHASFVYKLVILVDGNLASASGDSTIKVWNPNTGALLYTLIGHKSFVWTLAPLFNGNLASGSNDSTVKIWNPSTGKLVNNLTSHTSTVYVLVTLSNGNLASGSADNTVKIWT